MTLSNDTATGVLESELGAQFKELRLAKGHTQADLAARANVSLSALRNLESGSGSTLTTIIKVARALGRLDWVLDLYAEPEVSPIERLREQRKRRRPQRAPRTVRID